MAITCIGQMNYILDGMIIPTGCYIEDIVYEITRVIIDHLPVELVLFDRGFDPWGGHLQTPTTPSDVSHLLEKARRMVQRTIRQTEERRMYHCCPSRYL